jgi:hypothetical protein
MKHNHESLFNFIACRSFRRFLSIHPPPKRRTQSSHTVQKKKPTHSSGAFPR